MFQPGANLYGIGVGSRPENVEVPFLGTTAPASTNTNFPLGKVWIDTVGNRTYTLTSFSSAGGVLSATWSSGGEQPASTTVAGIVTITDNNEPVATKFYVDAAIAGVVVGAVPSAQLLVNGIV